MRSIRDWYLLSRTGSRSQFLAEIDRLTPDGLVDLVRHELKQAAVRSLRTLEDIANYRRVDLPSLAELKQRKPNEQTLQYFFMQRGYFRSRSEVVLAREYPSCDRREKRRAVIDLLAFDVENNNPLLVELKQAKANDPLFGVVLEALDHWIFFTRNFRWLAAVLSQVGHRCQDASPIQLAIAAPKEYFVETQRRSAKDSVRNREYSLTIDALTCLAKQVGLAISLVSIDDDWQDSEGEFSVQIWWQPPLDKRETMRCFYGSCSPQSFATIVHQMCDGEFLNLTRSTVPSLHYWREPEATLAHVFQGIGLSADAHGALCFEYPVPSAGGNKPSFSDLMYTSTEVSIAFEAKSTEPLGETTKQWLAKKKNSANATRVLHHWLTLIERVTGRARMDDIQDLPYQMIHRVASLCFLNSSSRALVYQHHRLDFDMADFSVPLTQLAKVIGAPGRIEIWLHLIDLQRTTTFLEVEQSLKGLSPSEMALRIRRAIFGGKLFEVKREEFQKVCS